MGKRNAAVSMLSMIDWQRLLAVCPLECSGNMATGDFLACSYAGDTRFGAMARDNRVFKIGNRTFVYIPEHDLIVRDDFRRWAIANWKTVLRNIPAKRKGL